MLALRRFRCLLHSTPASQPRSLKTQPRELPTYSRRWDPTKHKPTRLTSVQNKSYEFPRAAQKDEASQKAIPKPPTATRRESNPGDIVIKYKSRNTKAAYWIKRLSHILNRISTEAGLDQSLRAPLWRAYSFAKHHDAKLPTLIPVGAWDILWSSVSGEQVDMSRRKDCLAVLDRDMRAVNAPYVAGQSIYHIERRFMTGQEQQALDEWEGSCRDFSTRPEYLDTGVRLYALAGNADRAREIMDELFTLAPDWDHSVMMAVFRAYTSSDSKQHLSMAKEIYKDMRDRIGSSATIETYDSWLVGFLEARSLTLAKAVFRDMVRGGHLETEGRLGRVDEVLKRLNLLYALATDVSTMTTIALDVISLLPRAYHGHIFGDWMKSAVARNASQAAAQILDMMLHRGYEPESFHFNLLLRALLRSEQSRNILKAEDLGWKMIEEARLSMPKDRSAPKSRTKDIEARLKTVSVMDAHPAIVLPPASVSTFALIMQHHAERQQWEHVDYLARQLQLANIAPNTSIMNVLINNKCRQGKFTEAWQLYRSLTDDPNATASVFPNGESIRCLWKTLRLALADPAARKDPKLPTPRKLLRETVDWWALCRSRHDADRFLLGLTAADHGAITALILHCFSYMQDLPGSLVALHVLRHKFDIRVTNKVSEILQRQAAWVDMHEETESERLQFSFDNSSAKNLEQVTQIYRSVSQRRSRKLKNTRETYHSHSKDNLADVELDVIGEFVRIILLRKFPPEVVELMIDTARDAVGLPHLPTGDKTAFELV